MQTHMKLQYEFSREFLKTILANLPPLASAAWCGPHPLATPVPWVIEIAHYKDMVLTGLTQ